MNDKFNPYSWLFPDNKLVSVAAIDALFNWALDYGSFNQLTFKRCLQFTSVLAQMLTREWHLRHFSCLHIEYAQVGRSSDNFIRVSCFARYFFLSLATVQDPLAVHNIPCKISSHLGPLERFGISRNEKCRTMIRMLVALTQEGSSPKGRRWHVYHSLRYSCG